MTDSRVPHGPRRRMDPWTATACVGGGTLDVGGRGSAEGRRRVDRGTAPALTPATLGCAESGPTAATPAPMAAAKGSATPDRAPARPARLLYSHPLPCSFSSYSSTRSLGPFTMDPAGGVWTQHPRGTINHLDIWFRGRERLQNDKN